MERRIFERITIPIRLEYEVKTRPKIVKDSVSRDVSGGGVCLSLKEKLLPTTELSMRVEIGNEKDIVTLRGKVVWSRRVEIVDDEGLTVYYDTGIELTDADPISINRIITHFLGKSF